MFDKRNLRSHCWEIGNRIKNFLLAKKSREFLIFLFFVFVSFCFWVLQVLNDDYETELSFPIRMKNVPENVVLTSELPEEMKVTVKDRGTVLINYLWGQTLYPLVIDFKDYAEKGNQVRIPSVSLSKKIVGQLNLSTKVEAVKPDTLEFIYTKGAAKTVPVRLCGEVRAERQYYISDTLFSPDSVKVYAPKAILDTITAAFTQSKDYGVISDTASHRVSFVSVKGARFVPGYTDVSLLVDVYAEKTVEVPVEGVNFPSDKVLRTFPSKVKVIFQVGLSRFMEVDEDDFRVVVDYHELEKGKEEKCGLVLERYPQGVTHIRLNPTKMDYIIEQRVGLR